MRVREEREDPDEQRPTYKSERLFCTEDKCANRAR